jgi:two-component system cell cycle sensor histidine kinase/response regulator CckA
VNAMENDKAAKLETLRLRAEQLIRESPGGFKDTPAEDIQSVIHELQVHQIELEMQNEELRRAQLALHAARDKYADLYDFAPTGYFTVSEKGLIQEANLTGATMLGVERGKLRGQPFSQFITGDTQDIFYRHRRKLMETRTKQGCELRLKQKDGSQFHAQLDCVVVQDDEGNITAFRLAVSDIEERMKAVKAIEQGKREWETTFDAISDWVCLIDLDHRIVRTNQSVKAHTGRPVEEIVGEVCCEVAHGTKSPIAACPTRRMLKTRCRESAELHLPEENKWLLVTVDPVMDDDGNLAGAVHIVRDITLLKKEEAERAKIEKLESLGVLAGGLAHDFNNVLAIILGNVSSAKMDAAPYPNIEEPLGEAEKGCLRAVKLTRQLLTFAKGGAPVTETASLNDVIAESADFALKGSNVSGDYALPGDVWLTEIDVGQISQVIHNLVLNAEQAMPEGGVVGIKVGNRVIGESDALPLPPGKYCHISIADKGIGIPQAHLSKIFDPYFSTKDKGSGLGLASSHSIVQKHGGHIWADSQLGVGTVFHVYLPATENEISQAKEISRAKEAGGESTRAAGRILVMDDEAPLRRLAMRALEKLGYQVESAGDGEETIEKYVKSMKEGEPFDMVILDLSIPGGMGGKETIRRLREIDPDVKGIVASGYSNDPVVANFRDYGFCGALPKPYIMADLGRIVHDVLTEDNK